MPYFSYFSLHTESLIRKFLTKVPTNKVPNYKVPNHNFLIYKVPNVTMFLIQKKLNVYVWEISKLRSNSRVQCGSVRVQCGSVRVQCGSFGSALACCKAGPSSNLGSAPHMIHLLPKIRWPIICVHHTSWQLRSTHIWKLCLKKFNLIGLT